MAGEYAQSLRKTPTPTKTVTPVKKPVSPISSSANVRESRTPTPPAAPRAVTPPKAAPARQSNFNLGRAASGVGSFIANELLGVDDFRNTVSHAAKGDFGAAAKSLSTGAFEAGTTIGAALTAIPTFGGSLAARGAVVAGKQGAKAVVKEVAQETAKQGAKSSPVKYTTVIPQQVTAGTRQLVTAGGGRGGRFVDDFVGTLAPAKPKIKPIKIPDPKAPKPKIEPIKIPDPKKAPAKPLSPNPPVKPGTYPPYRPGTPSPAPPSPKPPLPSRRPEPLPAPPRPTPQPKPQPKPQPGPQPRPIPGTRPAPLPGTRPQPQPQPGPQPRPLPETRPDTGTSPRSPWSNRPNSALPDASPLANLGLGLGVAAGTILGPDLFRNPQTSNPTQTGPQTVPSNNTPTNTPTSTVTEETKRRQDFGAGFGGGVGQQDVFLKKVF